MTGEHAGAKMGQMNPGSPQGSLLPFRLQAILKPALFRTLVAALALVALVSLGARATDADPSFDNEEQAFLALINEYRLQNGRAPLITDCRLNAAADWFANDMAIDNYWASNHHDNEDPPRSPRERAAAFGFDAPVGENLAAGFTTAAVVFQAWQSSPGHDSNMLKESYVVIGIGRAYHPAAQYGWYWVTDFSAYVPPPAQPQCAPPATPTPTPSQTGEPPPQPTTEPLVWGDTDCDSQIGPLDSLRILRLDAGLSTTTQAPCMAMGGQLFVNGTLQVWGDVNCDGLDPVDAILILRFDAGLPVQTPAGCPSLGELV
ncbi:MAG: CAP domain-containing protein [Chloroflexi bacterium]|nr:CAP domain-containing protein [Chloroflexota bacterium]